MEKQAALDFIERHRAVAVVRLPDANLFEPVAEALYDGGVRVVEITMTVPDALSLIGRAARSAPGDMLIGVGSVLDAATTRAAVEAGAQFVVSPITKEEVIREARDLGKAVMPGAFTPTEIQTAWEYGADVVKVFPADVVGMAFFRGVLAPMPHLKLMPTGGVSLTNGREWLQAGAWAVGVGGSLVDKRSLADRDFAQIRRNAEELTKNLGGGRGV
jgi:2-dehydro-3-deoxyphosphogluconate aldolase / (4S)-4-hydroxy-2-oxoglutarate aldolase